MAGNKIAITGTRSRSNREACLSHKMPVGSQTLRRIWAWFSTLFRVGINHEPIMVLEAHDYSRVNCFDNWIRFKTFSLFLIDQRNETRSRPCHISVRPSTFFIARQVQSNLADHLIGSIQSCFYLFLFYLARKILWHHMATESFTIIKEIQCYCYC